MSIHAIDGLAQERRKYQQLWSLDDYQAALSPGLEFLNRFLTIVQPVAGASILDIGCGSGKAGLKLRDEHGFDVWWLDLTDQGLDPAVPRDRFIERALWQDFASVENVVYASRHNLQADMLGLPPFDYGLCCDVLEHIPPEFTMLAVEQILRACGTTWLHISNRSDNWGKSIDDTLHLTVQSYSWWLIRISTIAKVIDGRDLCGSSSFVVTR